MEFLPRDEFLRHTVSSADKAVCATLLVQARDSGHVDEYFRFIIHGGVRIHCTFEAGAIFSFPEAEGVRLRFDTHPQDIILEFNTTASRYNF